MILANEKERYVHHVAVFCLANSRVVTCLLNRASHQSRRSVDRFEIVHVYVDSFVDLYRAFCNGELAGI